MSGELALRKEKAMKYHVIKIVLSITVCLLLFAPLVFAGPIEMSDLTITGPDKGLGL